MTVPAAEILCATSDDGPAAGAGNRGISRQAEATRRALIDAAVPVFAEYGYDAASVRAITADADVNQGAITYHFGGKEGLYRAVLEAVVAQFSAQPLLDAAGVDRLPLAEVVPLFIRQMLAPLAEGHRARRHLRIFAWEQLKPTVVRRQFAAERPFPSVVLAGRIIRRFRPEADDVGVAIATAWLMGQVASFIRDGEHLAGPPFNLALDAGMLDRLVVDLSVLCLGGLGGADAPVKLTDI